MNHLEIIVVWLSASLLTLLERDLMTYEVVIPILIAGTITPLVYIVGEFFSPRGKARRRHQAEEAEDEHSFRHPPAFIIGDMACMSNAEFREALIPANVIPFHLYEDIETMEVRLFCHDWEINKIWGERGTQIERLNELTKVLILVTHGLTCAGVKGTLVAVRGHPNSVFYAIKKIMDVIRDIPLPAAAVPDPNPTQTQRSKLIMRVPVEAIPAVEGENKRRTCYIYSQTGASVRIGATIAAMPSGAKYKIVRMSGTAFQVFKARDLIDRLIEESGYPMWRLTQFRFDQDFSLK